HGVFAKPTSDGITVCMVTSLIPPRGLRSADHPLTRNAIIHRRQLRSADRAAAARLRAARQPRSRAQHRRGGSYTAPAATVAHRRLMGPEAGLRRVALALSLSGPSLFPHGR